MLHSFSGTDRASTSRSRGLPTKANREWPINMVPVRGTNSQTRPHSGMENLMWLSCPLQYLEL